MAFVAGGLFFYKLVIYLEKHLAEGVSFIVGTALDDIPETLSMGIGFASGDSLGIILALSVFLHNLPEGLSSTNELVNEGGVSKRKARVIHY